MGKELGFREYFEQRISRLPWISSQVLSTSFPRAGSLHDPFSCQGLTPVSCEREDILALKTFVSEMVSTKNNHGLASKRKFLKFTEHCA